jgi:type II secretion system protein G
MKKGFTLIELLVVVAIISLLSSIVMVSLNSAREKGRDAKRIRDIQEIHTAIELYILDYGQAPNIFATDKEPSWNVLANKLKPYIPKLPQDPCGTAASCFDYPKASGSPEDWLAYVYYGPSSLVGLVEDYFGINVDSTTYIIMAENLESKASGFGFGPSTF